VGLEVLKRRNRPVNRGAGAVMHRLVVRVAAEAGVEQQRELIVDEAVLGHLLGFGQQAVLPGAVGVGGPQDLLGPIERLGNGDNAAEFTGLARAGGCEPR
jgi:hypothetical protein